MANPARLLPHERGEAVRIEVDSALSDELIEDLTEAGFDAEESDVGVAVVDGVEVSLVELPGGVDESGVTAFLVQWNAKERGD